jgi:hypothetical protein|tara:strand:+ start:1019 stop:1354 length:336 start_codon:yes stop_codon:yes gene_type:complete
MSDNSAEMRKVLDKLTEAPDNPFDTEIYPPSGGTYDIKTLQSNVARQLMDMAKRISTADINDPTDPFDVRQVYKILYSESNPVFKGKMETLVQAYDGLAKQNRYKRKFGEY